MPSGAPDGRRAGDGLLAGDMEDAAAGVALDGLGALEQRIEVDPALHRALQDEEGGIRGGLGEVEDALRDGVAPGQVAVVFKGPRGPPANLDQAADIAGDGGVALQVVVRPLRCPGAGVEGTQQLLRRVEVVLGEVVSARPRVLLREAHWARRQDAPHGVNRNDHPLFDGAALQVFVLQLDD